VDPAVARDIEAAVGEALGRFGVSGQVVFLGRLMELRGRGPAVAIDVEQLGEQWPLLPPDLRARKAGEVARRLVQAYRAANPGGEAAAPPTGALMRILAIAISGVIIVAVLGFFLVRLIRSEDAPPPPPEAPPLESPEETAARQARVCEAARSRIFSGASMAALDKEGWIVELWLASKQPVGSEAFGELLSGGKLGAKADEELAALPNAQVEVAPGFDPAEAARFQGWHAVTLRFTGGYVAAYLDPGKRARFVSLADRLADAVSAELGAFYGRCAHLPHHDLGGWFRGADAPAAAAALVYGAGFFTEQPALGRRAMEGLGPSPLDGLRAAAAKLDAAELGRLIGAEGGSITAGAGKAITMTFPVGGPTRATRASRIVAQKIGLGGEGG
jgi:serine/threonine-protein kinase